MIYSVSRNDNGEVIEFSLAIVHLESNQKTAEMQIFVKPDQKLTTECTEETGVTEE